MVTLKPTYEREDQAERAVAFIQSQGKNQGMDVIDAWSVTIGTLDKVEIERGLPPIPAISPLKITEEQKRILRVMGVDPDTVEPEIPRNESEERKPRSGGVIFRKKPPVGRPRHGTDPDFSHATYRVEWNLRDEETAHRGPNILKERPQVKSGGTILLLLHHWPGGGQPEEKGPFASVEHARAWLKEHYKRTKHIIVPWF